MALIQCPICGNIYAEDRSACPRCMLRTEPEKPAAEDNALPLRIWQRAVIAAGVVLFVAAAIVLSMQNRPVSVTKLTLSELPKEDMISNYDELSVHADINDPFIAVVANVGEQDCYLAYVKNGEGMLQIPKGEKADSLPVGYLKGYEINRKILSDWNTSISYGYNYLNGERDINISVAVELRSRRSGLLVLSVGLEGTDCQAAPEIITVIDGKGDGVFSLSDTSRRGGDPQVQVMPEFFCPYQPLREWDYSVREPFSVEQAWKMRERNFSVKEPFSVELEERLNVYRYSLAKYVGHSVYEFPDRMDGVIAYFVEVLPCGDEYHSYTQTPRLAYLHNGVLTLKTTEYVPTQDGEAENPPSEYAFEIKGYLPILALPEQ